MKLTYETFKKGNLGLMLVWQSLDGRLEIKYFSNLKEVRKLYKHLLEIGRHPLIWRRIKDI